MLVILSAGCPTREPAGGLDPVDPVDPGEHVARFVGEWLVDQPYHALYEATIYRFGPDGAIAVLDSCNLGYGDDYVTGSVTDETTGTRCVFGERWRSVDDVTLIVEGLCDDGRVIDISLGFPSDASGNAAGVDVQVVSADEDGVWAHRFPEWNWARCDGPCPALPEWCG